MNNKERRGTGSALSDIQYKHKEVELLSNVAERQCMLSQEHQLAHKTSGAWFIVWCSTSPLVPQRVNFLLCRLEIMYYSICLARKEYLKLSNL